jgi:hypothetical protein
MATTSRYTLVGNGANFMDFYLPYGALSLAGQEIVFKGNTGVDRLYVGKVADLVLDFSQSLQGTDQLYLSGSWADYAKTFTGSVLTLTRTVGGNEVVKVISGDSLVFADGTVPVLNALNFLKGTAVEPVPAGEATGAFPVVIDGVFSNTARVTVQDQTG